ncbi:potassium transporter-domain-containing protein [Zychaea mexicana]|uniref:potassium transporter-domain-containing protein n=1 Tax=Zychaea mexicana TaxID=64656 RepID=UPI0022FE0870|nr:potassium transporter-domain-containing protein [Zychaea mexicana]KAI9495852.1 potassium transporter-domain-containing protein [Zychaea mexicana]
MWHLSSVLFAGKMLTESKTDKLDLDPESILEFSQEKTIFNSIQTKNSKDVLMNTDAPSRPVISKKTTLFLAYQAIGVIYGDIGTSPLYTYSSTFTDNPTREDVLGALSVIIWSMTLVVSVKYCIFVLSANDHGEGGTFALYSLLSRYANINWNNPNAVGRAGFKRYPTGDIKSVNRGLRRWIENSSFLRHLINLLSIIGVCMVIADGMLTPAQSVIGAIQGLRVEAPQITIEARTGISEVILILIFLIQGFGTTKIGVTYAPIVIIWLLLNLSCGIYSVIKYDASVFQAFSPYWIYHWFASHGTHGWEMLGGTLMSITGMEALFADVGHFSPTAVRFSWLFFAYPCLLMAYIGEAAVIVSDSTNTAWLNPFYSMVPAQAFWFAFVIAVLAAIVASQAMITGCFSILSQAMNLSCFPQLKVVHTSTRFKGQVYIPVANWLLMLGTLAVAGGFQDTTALGNAYGACVITTAFITTILMTLVTSIVWRWNIFFSIAFLLFFGLIDGAYLTSTLRKVPQGAWFTIVVAAVLSAVMYIWRYGTLRQWEYEGMLKLKLRKDMLLPEESSDANTVANQVTTKLNTTMIVFDPAGFDSPMSIQHLQSVLHVEPTVQIFCHLRHANIANVPADERMIVFKPEETTSTYRIILRQGYNDLPDTSAEFGIMLSNRIAQLLQEENLQSELDIVTAAQAHQLTYLTNTINVNSRPGAFFIHRFLIEMYAWLRRNTMGNQQEMYGVPVEKMIQIGIQYEL